MQQDTIETLKKEILSYKKVKSVLICGILIVLLTERENIYHLHKVERSLY